MSKDKSKAFFLVIMLLAMDMVLGIVGSSRSATGFDISSIYKHGRAFFDMGSDMRFSTAVAPVWTAS